MNIRELRNELLEEIRHLPPGPLALQKIAYLRSEYDYAIDDYRHSLGILSDTAYQDRKHFLLEFIQNADDADFGRRPPTLVAKIFDDRIEFLYNEAGFTTANVLAITGTGASTKTSKGRAKSFIGEKGIGFKSVFALAAEVEIESPPWHFKLTAETIIVPMALSGGLLGPGDGTRLAVRFKDPASIETIARELLGFVSGHTESFLFLQRLSDFSVEDYRDGGVSVRRLEVHPASRSGSTISLRGIPSNDIREYALYTETMDFPPELVATRWERMAGTTEPLAREVTVAAPLAHRDEEFGRLFCFLPTEVRLPVPLYLQVDGHLTAGRERLHAPDENTWNRHLLAFLPEFLVRSFSHWRQDPTIAPLLLNYIPVGPGVDQLSPVFEQAMLLLQTTQWIRAFEECPDPWVEPGDALVAADFWVPWFQQYPDFRAAVEDEVGKRFVCPNWVIHPKWDEIEGEYEVGRMSSTHLIAALTSRELPESLVHEDENLVALYRHVIGIFKGLGRWESYELRRRILAAPIFPLGHGQFGPLTPAGDPIQAYWVSTRSRRSTGLESTGPLRLVDPEYTFVVDVRDGVNSADSQLKERNEVVRELLKALQVQELDDERVLVDLQIPYLLARPHDNQPHDKYNVLARVFEAYRAKRTNRADPHYLAQLVKLRDAKFRGSNGGIMTLGECLLPDWLRLSEQDHLFDLTDLPAFDLPDAFFEVMGQRGDRGDSPLREDLREFLIHCGVRAHVEFRVLEETYGDQSHFRYQDEQRSRLWENYVGSDYTWGNPIKVLRSTLDHASLTLLSERQVVSGPLADAIYGAWQTYTAEVDTTANVGTWWYRGNPPVGLFVAKYKRYQDRSVLLSDANWGGASPGLIPVRTVSGETRAAKACVRSPNPMASSQLTHSGRFFPLVCGGPRGGEPGYDLAYLQSLDIPIIDAGLVNERWHSVEPEERLEFLEALVELIHAGLSPVNLLIHDNQTGRLRPLHEFRLGARVREDVPFIEEQYGEMGRKLGMAGNLRTESQAATYCERMTSYLESVVSEATADTDALLGLLIELRTMLPWDKREVIAKMPGIFQQTLNAVPFLFAIGDCESTSDHDAVVAHLKSQGKPVIELRVSMEDKDLCEIQARELGFRTVDEAGQLRYANHRRISEAEAQKVLELLLEYLNLLQPHERSRFHAHPLLNGNDTTLERNVVLAAGLFRSVTEDIMLPLDLPYYEHRANRFVGRLGDSPEELLACAISLCELAPYRNVIADLQQISRERRIDEEAASPESNHTPISSMQQFRAGFADGLTDRRAAFAVKEGSEWRMGLDPEEEASVRENIAQSLGVDHEDHAEVRVHHRELEPVMSGTPDEIRIRDDLAVQAKDFLMSQYDGRCQICATQLVLSTGKKWIEIYRIREQQESPVWANKPFNTLGLCPNCHALLKHGGDRDLRPITRLAREVSQQSAFPVEAPEFHGDYYVAEIKVNGKTKPIVYSQIHMSYVVEYLRVSDENYL